MGKLRLLVQNGEKQVGVCLLLTAKKMDAGPNHCSGDRRWHSGSSSVAILLLLVQEGEKQLGVRQDGWPHHCSLDR